jgi:hypothetical protein
MSISGEVAASIENSTSAADSNGDTRSAPLTQATSIIPASRAATTAWWMRPRQSGYKHRKQRGRRPVRCETVLRLPRRVGWEPGWRGDDHIPRGLTRSDR